MPANQANVILQAFKPLLIGLVTAGFVSGGLVILAVWLLISQFSAMSGFMAIVLITCALMSLLMAFRFYARISLQLAQNDQKHLQNALIQAKDMLDTSKQLRDDHVLLQSLLQNLPFPVWLKDRFGRYLVYNQAFVQQWCGGTDAKGKTDEELLNPQLAEAADGNLDGVLGYTEEPLASCDFNHDPRSGIVDASQTRVSQQKLVKVLIWFDNEWGYANRMLDTLLSWHGIPPANQ